MDAGHTLRLQHLQSNITRALTLLNETESAILLEQNPVQRARFQADVDRLRDAIDKYSTEYQALSNLDSPETAPALQSVARELHLLSSRIDSLSDQHTRSSAAILSQMQLMQDRTIATVLLRLDQTQQQLVSETFNALAQLPTSPIESSQIIVSVSAALQEAQRRVSGPDKLVVEELSRIVDDPKLDVGNKLKLSVPIVPFLLSYEVELNLKSGANLRAAWSRLMKAIGMHHA